MKNTIIFIGLICYVRAKLTTPSQCRNCVGKLHKKEDLQLVKQPLLIDKQQICVNEKYKFIIIVKSGSFQRRNFTRSTWGKEIVESWNVPILYAIGYPKNEAIQSAIVTENMLYQDILQFNILESYYNLTLKTTSVLYWYNKYCSNRSEYLLYVDDDILVHVETFMLYMHTMDNHDAIQGWFENSGKIQRKGVGGVSREDFPIDIVPDYLWGATVLYPSKILANALVNAIFNTTLPIFFRDDVFINGFIAEEANVKRKHMKGILLYDATEDDLKRNMIIIDFKNEEAREHAWNCFKYNRQCNKNLPLLLLKIFCGIISSVIIISICCRCFLRAIYCKLLKNELYCRYRDMDHLFKGYMATGSLEYSSKYSTNRIQPNLLPFSRSITLRRKNASICCIFIFAIILYFSFK